MKSISFALIGCGKIAEQHVRSLQQLRSVGQIVALCDLSIDNIERFARRHNLDHVNKDNYYTDVDALLLREEVDCVVITTSSDLHAPITMKALRRGKHVLVEKPMALSIQDARKMVDYAEMKGLVLAVSLQTRYLPQIQAIKEAIDAGDFGRIVHGVVSVRWHRDSDYYAGSPWRGTWEKDGGVFMNQCIHYIDLLQWMMGPLQSIYGQADTFVHPIETDDAGVAVMKFKNGAMGILEGSTCIYPKNLQTSLSLFGDRGSVSLEGERLNAFRNWQFKNKQREDALPLVDAISYAPLYEDLIRSINTGIAPLVSGRSALASLETILAFYKSVKLGSPVTLPIQKFSALDMKE